MMPAPFPESYWLEPERVLCGEYPRSRTETPDHPKTTALLGAGVRVFIDLTCEGELGPYFPEIVVGTAEKLGISPEEIEHRRHEIVDQSVPDAPADMRAALRAIRSARHRRKIPYIHCWGGVGRTGTVAACFLSDMLGLRSQASLDAFQNRWKACGKSAHRCSPETGGQENYVRNWNNERPDRVSQIRAAVLGAAVGDALGVPVEFCSRSDRKSDPVEGMREFGTHSQPAGTWSDDTSLILATMDGFVKAGGYDPAAAMEEFRAWRFDGAHTPHGNLFDIGGATSQAIAQFASGTPATECGGRGEYSNGNGSLMRIVPVALAFGDDPELVEKASQISALTHAHERSRFCSAFYCLVVSELLHGATIEESTQFAWEVMDARWDFSPPERERFEKLRPDRLFAREEDDIVSGGHVIDTLEAALWVNARHSWDSYAEAVLHAVNLGGDTDTTGCVAGALAALVHGESSIPEPWLCTLAKHDEITGLCEAFAAVS
jgi:ADP-ribosylglycohydrolase